MTENEILNLIEQANSTAFNKLKENRDEEAQVLLNQILRVRKNEKSLHLLGLLAHKKSEFVDAVDFFQEAIGMNVGNYENYNNVAVCYSSLGNYKKAIKYIKKAICLKPEYCFYNNLALQYRHLENYDKSIKYLKKALKIKNNEISWGMMGGCYGEKKELEKAEKCYKKALEIKPDFAAAHVDLACIYHLKSEWEKAWIEYEWRTEVFEQLKIWKEIYNPEKRWKGEDLAGKRIIIHGEQGHGDFIHFFRYVPLLKGHVILHCSEVLKPLFKNQEIYTVDPKSKDLNLPEHDYHCSILSLPYILKCEIPQNPYLSVKNKINLDGNKFKIGIVWAGNPQHPNDRFRSCPLKLFEPIERLNVQIYSLMKDVRARAYLPEKKPIDLTEGTNSMNIIDLSNLMTSFEKTAEIINSLDLIITVDTALLHLSGALGKQTLALIPYNNDWRWTNSGNKTVWYPTVELFRQSQKGEWGDVIDKIKKRVEEVSSTL